VIDVSYGGLGLSTVAYGDLLVGSTSNQLVQLPVGTSDQVLKVVDGSVTWAVNDTSGVSLTDTTNFPSQTNVQEALDYLYEFTKIRKLMDHVITSCNDYSGSIITNPNFGSGKIQFINYDASNVDIYIPYVSTGMPRPDGTVYRIVHNGLIGEPNYIIRYRDIDANTVINALEVAPGESISLIWNVSTASYLYGVGI
jgi:hypothetical protein